jgi:lipopolysaccharide export system permease protein
LEKSGHAKYYEALVMKLIDRYIITRFLTTFFFILGVIMSIAIIFDVSEQIDDLIKNEAPFFGVLFEYYLNFVLIYGNLFSPLLVFLSVIFFTSQLASRTEIVAILSGGVSFNRLMLPYFISATILAAMSFYLNNYLVPRANETRIAFEGKYIHTYKRSLTTRIHKQIRPGEMIYFDKYNRIKDIGYSFTYELWDDIDLKTKIFANYVKWDTINENWILENFYIRHYHEDGETLIEGQTLDTMFAFLPEEFSARVEDVQMMNVHELDDYIESETLKGSKNIPFYLIEKHSRNALPFSTYILTIIGVSMSSRKVRGGLGAHIAAGLALAVTYILAMKVTTVYATNAGLDPLVAVWIPNLIYGCLAVYLFAKAPK